jgi:hypothetical protein
LTACKQREQPQSAYQLDLYHNYETYVIYAPLMKLDHTIIDFFNICRLRVF